MRPGLGIDPAGQYGAPRFGILGWGTCFLRVVSARQIPPVSSRSARCVVLVFNARNRNHDEVGWWVTVQMFCLDASHGRVPV